MLGWLCLLLLPGSARKVAVSACTEPVCVLCVCETPSCFHEPLVQGAAGEPLLGRSALLRTYAIGIRALQGTWQSRGEAGTHLETDLSCPSAVGLSDFLVGVPAEQCETPACRGLGCHG